MALVPKAEAYYRAGLNVLLIGKHGVGKTQSLMEMCEELGITMKYYSCSTLDPFTDLVGVPVPRETEEGIETLKMIRPHEIDEAELIFFDELNRADDKTLNAVFEIIQFGSINGEKLKNLKCCWAAINPPEEGYHVQELDPALIDRFDVYEQINPTPTVAYLSTKMAKPIAQALVAWFSEHNQTQRDDESYISPRRLEKIGTVVQALGLPNQVPKLLPPGGSYDSSKLMEMLKVAMAPESMKTGEFNKAALGPNEQIVYKGDWIVKNVDDVVNILQDEKCTDETKKKVVKALSDRVGPERWIGAMDKILPHVEKMWIEAEIADMPQDKVNEIRWKIDNETDLGGLLWGS